MNNIIIYDEIQKLNDPIKRIIKMNFVIEGSGVGVNGIFSVTLPSPIVDGDKCKIKLIGHFLRLPAYIFGTQSDHNVSAKVSGVGATNFQLETDGSYAKSSTLSISPNFSENIIYNGKRYHLSHLHSPYGETYKWKVTKYNDLGWSNEEKVFYLNDGDIRYYSMAVEIIEYK